METTRRREDDRLRHFVFKQIIVPLCVGAIGAAITVAFAAGELKQKIGGLDGIPERLAKVEQAVFDIRDDMREIRIGFKKHDR